MPTLECPNVFELVLPEGFSVSGEPGRSYDIEGPEGSGLGLGISVYSPVPPKMQSEGARRLLTAFVATTGANTDDIKIATPSGEGERAFTFFTNEGRDWFAGFLLFPGGALLATANTESGNAGSLRVGEQLIASIYPVKARRRLFGRR